MRIIPALMIILALTGCDLVDFASSSSNGPVDASTLPPLTSREQSLIYGADGAYQQGNFAAAEHDYLSAVSISTGHIDAHLALARLYEKQHQPVNERAILERALALQPNHPLANYLMGKLELDENRNMEARAAFTRGLLSQPDNIDLAVGQAVADDMLGQHEKAQATYTRIMRLNPKGNFSGVRTNLAMSYLLSGMPKKAVDLLQAEAKKPNSSSVTRHNLALAYGLLGRNAEAKKLLNGDIDEETRLLTVARLKDYIKERADGANPSVPKATIDRDESPLDLVKSKPMSLKKVGPVSTPISNTSGENSSVVSPKPITAKSLSAPNNSAISTADTAPSKP